MVNSVIECSNGQEELNVCNYAESLFSFDMFFLLALIIMLPRLGLKKNSLFH